MKQVIIVCLLSLLVCLSQASTPLETQQTQAPVVGTQLNDTTAEPKTNVNDTKQKEQPLLAKPTEGATKSTDTQNATSPNATQNQTSPATPNETSSKTNENKPTEQTNSTTVTVKPATSTEKTDLKGNNETKPVIPSPATNGTTADGKDSKKNETTTPKGDNVSPTAAPVEAKSRAFDGPSFIGGIILTLGLLSIGFMGFKYYKNQTERNYHTL